MIDLQLRSNVRQPYDYCFSQTAEWVFLRMYYTPTLQKEDFSRRQMFNWLNNRGIETVPHGTVIELLKKYDPKWGLVVYTDERLHRGEGKEWCSNEEALRKYPNHYASLFIPPAGKAIRHFQFGDRSFFMPFQTFDDWRCQKGATTYSYCVEGSLWNLFPHVINYPYFALDFIPGTNMATDFQFVPGTTDDRLDNWMRPREMYQALQRAAMLLIEKGLVDGNQEKGFGLIKACDLKDEANWLRHIGSHGDKDLDNYEKFDYTL